MNCFHTEKIMNHSYLSVSSPCARQTNHLFHSQHSCCSSSLTWTVDNKTCCVSGMAAVLPRTLGELQLYRILQRANLLYYYEAFIQQGGDDVQQLCEAGEEEFLEIMALVGMASKPLHVRRLQKALRDWVTNPAIFNQPLTSLPVCSIPVYKLPEGSPTLLSGQDRANTASVKIPKAVAAACSDPGKLDVARDKVSAGSPLQGSSEARFWSGHSNDSEHSLSPSDLGSPSSPRDVLEALDAAAVQSVLECVDRMAPGLPKTDLAEVKEQLKNNKKLAKMIGHILEMNDDDPRREEEIRKYSAIYGRFDSKRRDGKHLTLHEVRATICSPTLLGFLFSRLNWIPVCSWQWTRLQRSSVWGMWLCWRAGTNFSDLPARFPERWPTNTPTAPASKGLFKYIFYVTTLIPHLFKSNICAVKAVPS